MAQRQEQVSEKLIVPDRVGLQKNERWAEADSLADGDPGPDGHATGDRGDHPYAPGVLG